MNDIRLIELGLRHLEMVRKWRNSPEVSKYMYSDKAITSEQQVKWFERTKNDSTCKYWIIQYGEKELGLASITNIDHVLNSCYWAFYLGDESIRASGIGAKVEYQILNYVFEELKLNKLRCEVFAFNGKVIKMHEKFGFRQEALYRGHCKKNGTYEDVVGLGLLKSEWRMLKPLLKQMAYAIKTTG